MIEEAVGRIRRMEQIFDILQDAADRDPASIPEDESLRKQLRTLVGYYEDGLWRKDYELDESGLLPQNLKRGVLAQDAVYDLLHQLKAYINI